MKQSFDVNSDIICWILLMLSLYKEEKYGHRRYNDGDRLAATATYTQRARDKAKDDEKKYDKFRMNRHTKFI